MRAMQKKCLAKNSNLTETIKLTITFHVALEVVFSLVQLPPVLILLQLGSEAVRRRAMFPFGRVMGRGHAGAVRCTRCQRLAVAQDVFDKEGGGGSPRYTAGPTAELLLLLRRELQTLRLVVVMEMVVVLQAVLHHMRVGVLHGDRDGG